MYSSHLSWSIRSSLDDFAVTMLYLMDAAGMTGPAGYDVPPLHPAVELDAGLAPRATENASDQWDEWWRDHFEPPGPAHPEGLPELPLPPHQGTDLRMLFDMVIDRVQRYTRDTTRMYVRRVHAQTPQARRIRIQNGQTVRRVEQELGRTATPFRLTERLLPLDRKWGKRIRPDLVLVSTELRCDPDSYDLFLEPVVRSLA
jgi:hypothetical protein